MKIHDVRSIVNALAMATATNMVTTDLLRQVEDADVPVAQHLVGLVGEDRAEVYESAAAGELSASAFAGATYAALRDMEDE